MDMLLERQSATIQSPTDFSLKNYLKHIEKQDDEVIWRQQKQFNIDGRWYFYTYLVSKGHFERIGKFENKINTKQTATVK